MAVIFMFVKQLWAAAASRHLPVHGPHLCKWVTHTNQAHISEMTAQDLTFPTLLTCREWWVSLFWTSRHQLQGLTSDWSGEQTGRVSASWPPAVCLPGEDAVVNKKHSLNCPSSTNSAVFSFSGFLPEVNVPLFYQQPVKTAVGLFMCCMKPATKSTTWKHIWE